MCMHGSAFQTLTKGKRRVSLLQAAGRRLWDRSGWGLRKFGRGDYLPFVCLFVFSIGVLWNGILEECLEKQPVLAVPHSALIIPARHITMATSFPRCRDVLGIKHHSQLAIDMRDGQLGWDLPTTYTTVGAQDSQEEA